ncbi:MAG: uracil-DNA glycosylase family protein [Cyanobacteria bacterium P01_A01_bin.17]
MHWLTDPAETLFEAYAASVQTLATTETLSKAQLLIPRFHLHSEGQLEIYYAPLGYVRTEAKVALVGLTPGWQQMELSYRLAAELIVNPDTGQDTQWVMSEIKRRMSFAGPMRRNLLKMLDELGFAEGMGLTSSSAIFEDQADLVHTTSALRYPVFYRNGHIGSLRNYTGHNPKMLSRDIQIQMVEQLLGKELSQLSQALIIPMGEGATQAVRRLVEIDVIDEGQCLFGFPHPSGANGHRHRQFAAHRQRLKDKLHAWFRAFS